jgi:hypothetical protein
MYDVVIGLNQGIEMYGDQILEPYNQSNVSHTFKVFGVNSNLLLQEV